MGIRSLSAASISTGAKRSKFWDQSATLTGPSVYENIATVTVTSGGSSTITFSTIPSGYKHLQLRGIVITGANLASDVMIRFNNDAGSNYSWSSVYANGSSVTSGTNAASSYGGLAIQGDTTGPAPFIADILDFTDTNKYKTIKALSGYQNNSGGNIYYMSSGWRNTAAITSIQITKYPSGNFSQYSRFALYGIKES